MSVYEFYPELSVLEEFELLFNKIIDRQGKGHFPIYRMCDGEYTYCVGRKLPQTISFIGKLKYSIKTLLINTGFIVQRIGHANVVNKEVWFGEFYTLKEKKQLKNKFLNDLKLIASKGFLATYFVYSKGHFAEEYFQPMLHFFPKMECRLIRAIIFLSILYI